MKPQNFAGRQPELRLEDYFAGRTLAWGMFHDRFGGLRRQFRADVDGAWDGETLTLHEHFAYDDGEKEQRTWRIRGVGDHGYEGEADGVIGVARGSVCGNALHWRYGFALTVGARSWSVRFDDWMLLQRDGVLFNRARVTKFGLLIGRLTCWFCKPQSSLFKGH